MCLNVAKGDSNRRAIANPSNPIGNRVHFVSTFLQFTWQVMWPQGAAILFCRIKKTQCTIRMEEYFLKHWWKWNNECSCLFVQQNEKILFRLRRMNLILLRTGKCRHHLISRDLIWIKIVVLNYLQTKNVIIQPFDLQFQLNSIKFVNWLFSMIAKSSFETFPKRSRTTWRHNAAVTS